MSTAAKQRAKRKVWMVRIVAIALAALMLISILVATLSGGYY